MLKKKSFFQNEFSFIKKAYRPIINFIIYSEN